MTSQNPLELCLFDAGIKSLQELDVSNTIVHLNLHCNEIKTIANISHLKNLKYLDLSSNHITSMSGISSCVCLQRLNLASNQIKVVEGIERLSSLKMLNLSFNYIQDLSGLKCVKTSTHCLTQLEIYSNRISSLNHVVDCLRKCTSIQSLHLRQGTDTNPVCGIPAYRPNVLSQLPWLQNLDGFDKHGNRLEELETVYDIPGLDEFVQELEPSTFSSTNVSYTSIEHGSNYNDVITPKIDGVLLKFKQRKDTNISPQDKKHLEKRNDMVVANSLVNDRLMSLEEKLKKLTELYTEHEIKENNKLVLNITAGLNDSSSTEYTMNDEPHDDSNKIRHTKEPHSKQNVSSKSRKENKISQNVPLKIVQKEVIGRNSGTQKQTVAGRNNGTRKHTVVGRNNIARKHMVNNRIVRSTEDDETYLNLMHDVDMERERRWKAEQATRKLLDSLKSIKETLTEERKMQEAVVIFNAKLKQSLEKERETRNKFEERSKNFQEANEKIQLRLDEEEEARSRDQKLLKELQDNSSQLEKDCLENEMHYKKQLKELQLDSGGCKRELELLTNTATKQKEQLQQLQELLVLREQEHRLDLENKVSVDGREMREVVDKEILKCETKYKELVDQYTVKLNEKNIQYAALEDEFRMALEIEADRYNKLHEHSEEMNHDFKELKSTFEDVSKKEAKARGLVAELSTMVKEQKFKISEMLRSKQNIQKTQNSQMARVDEELYTLRKIASKFESLQLDKERMSAHIKGQESIIQGLRSERKLWGQELAQQGASLAQERGKLDVLVESQKKEIQQLHLQIADRQDSLKIKTKLIDDQTNTIRNMKEDLSKISEENKRLAEEEDRFRSCLEEELNETKISYKQIQETAVELTERKEELKSILVDREQELKQTKCELRNLRTQWNERSAIINDLESKVVKMKNKFDEKEKQINDELKGLRDKLKISNDRIHDMAEMHARTLLSNEHEYDLKLRKIIAEKDNERQHEKEKVMEIEEEMRVLLSETAAQKKQLEQRVKNLSKAFVDIQNDLQ